MAVQPVFEEQHIIEIGVSIIHVIIFVVISRSVRLFTWDACAVREIRSIRQLHL